jgi:hypothetical protein
MPGGDRTGPMGTGPMTGRGMGYCAGFPVPGFMNRPGWFGFGRGWFGRGGGRGWRHWFRWTGLTGWQRAAMGWPAWGAPGPIPPASSSPLSREQELEILNQQAENLSAALEEIRHRIDQLQRQSSSSSS